jgi:hypothetical protein
MISRYPFGLSRSCDQTTAKSPVRPRAILAARAVLLATLVVLVGMLGTAHEAAAASITVDTSTLAGTSGQLDFAFLDGDFVANNTVTISNLTTNGTLGLTDCLVGCTGGPPYVLDDALGLGQFLQDLTLGTFVSFDLSFTTNFRGSGVPDLLVLNLLDSNTSFTLVDTNLDALSGAQIPYQDALLLLTLTGNGDIQVATVTNPITPVTQVPEPSALLLVALGGCLLAHRRRRSVVRGGVTE